MQGARAAQSELTFIQTLDIYAAAFREREAQALGAVAAVLNEPISKKA